MKLDTTLHTTPISVRLPLDVSRHLTDNNMTIEGALVDYLGDYTRHGEYHLIPVIQYQWRYTLVPIECTQQIMTIVRAWMGRKNLGGRSPELDDIGKWLGTFLAYVLEIPIPSLSGKLASTTTAIVASKVRIEEGQIGTRDRRTAAKLSTANDLVAV